MKYFRKLHIYLATCETAPETKSMFQLLLPNYIDKGTSSK